MPYWNWTEDSSKEPKDMAVWNKDCMGGTGYPSNDFIVDEGPFRRWQIVGEDGISLGLLKRDLAGSGFRLPTSAQVSNALKDITSYDTSPWNNDS